MVVVAVIIFMSNPEILYKNHAKSCVEYVAQHSLNMSREEGYLPHAYTHICMFAVECLCSFILFLCIRMHLIQVHFLTFAFEYIHICMCMNMGHIRMHAVW